MDAYAHSAELVHVGDRDRYLADLFAPEELRRHLFALHAFNLEVARIRETATDPTLGEIRLQWWRDAIRGEGGGHPVATALAETIATFRLPRAAFDHLIEARTFDLYDDQMPSLNDLEGYAGETSSSLMQLAAIVLAGGADPGTAEIAGHAGVAFALTGLLRALPIHASRRQSYLPKDMVVRHGVDLEDVFAGRMTPGLAALLTEMRAVIRGHLASVAAIAPRLDRRFLPAFLPVALCEPHLKRMERPGLDPFRVSAEIAPLRRQWVLWRAARRGLA